MKKFAFGSKLSRQKMGGILRKNWGKRKKPLRIEVLDGGPIPSWKAEILKSLIRRVVLRKLSQSQEEISSTAHSKSIQTNPDCPDRHIIYKAIKWKKMLENGEFKSQSEIARKEGLTRVRVTQIMNLLRLPQGWKEFLIQLNEPKEIRKYSERRLRNYRPGRYPCALCPIMKNAHR